MDLISSYKQFCHVRDKSNLTNTIDLSNLKFLSPTTLLPLLTYIRQNKTKEYIEPLDTSVSSYLSNINTCKTLSKYKNYLPLTELPKDPKDAAGMLSILYDKLENGKNIGGQNAFKYMISEMVDNIYQHSYFKTAFFMAQKYSRNKYIEICFYDDGIGIPESFRRANFSFKDSVDAIYKALQGLSTKSQERGYGLSGNLRIIKEAFNGEMLVASEKGAIFLQNKDIFKYNFSDKYILSGTLVSYKYNFPVDIGGDFYEYVK